MSRYLLNFKAMNLLFYITSLKRKILKAAFIYAAKYYELEPVIAQNLIE